MTYHDLSTFFASLPRLVALPAFSRDPAAYTTAIQMSLSGHEARPRGEIEADVCMRDDARPCSGATILEAGYEIKVSRRARDTKATLVP